MILRGEVEGTEWLQSSFLNWIRNAKKNILYTRTFFLLHDTYPNNQGFSTVNKY